MKKMDIEKEKKKCKNILDDKIEKGDFIMLKVNKKLNAIIAIEIILTMTLYYFIFVGATAVTYALDVVKTNHTNIDFSAYFLNSNGEKVEKLEDNIDKEEYLYVDVSVYKEGYFNGTIYLDNSNFNIKQEILSPNIAEISGNEVKLNQINAGSTATIKLAIEAKKENVINETTLDTRTEVVLVGQYANSKNIEKDNYVEINGTAEVEMSWKSSENTNAELGVDILTNYVYKENEEEKRVVQILVNSKITDNNYPVKNTEINLSVLENVKEIKVHARNTKATNSNMNFDDNNYTYDKESNKLIIKLSNEDTNNISWEKNVQDTFVITYIFDKEENVTNKEIKVNSTIKTYDDKEFTENQDVTIEKEIDGIVSYSIENTEEGIFKGKIYTGEERDYTVINKVNIDYLNVVNNITIKGNEATYIAGEKEGPANIIYKETKIEKEEFLEIFGEEGYITVKNGEGEVIANINSNSEANENGEIKISYLGETKNIEITTSKPIALGTLNIENTKAILNSGYSRDVVDMLTGIKEEIVINDAKAINLIKLKETETVANIEVETEKILTWQSTQNLNLKVKLDTKDESKKLYKDAKFIITLPSELTNVELQQASILYGNGLSIKNYELTTNDYGQYQVIITTLGEQKTYNTTESTEIYIYTTVDIGILTPTQIKPVELNYTNENDVVSYTTSTNLSIESTNGLMLYNKVINFNDANDEIATYEESAQTGILDRNSNRDNFIMATDLVNNYEEAINDVVIMGKIPSSTNENNTYTAFFNQIVINQDATIYYSTDANATPEDDTWTEDKTNAVAYKIVIDTIEAKQVIKIALRIDIPQNLEYNEQGEFTTKVSYKYQNMELQKNSNIILKTETSVIALKTNALGVTNTFENGLITNIIAITGNKELKDGDSIYEGQTIKYYITVTNETNQDMTNVQVAASQVNGKVWELVDIEAFNPGTQENQIEKHYKQTQNSDITIDTIENIKKGESRTLTYEAYANDLEENSEVTTYGIINVKSEEQSINENLKTPEVIIKEAEWALSITEGRRQDAELYDGDTLKLRIDLTNKKDIVIPNMIIKIIYSSKLKYKDDLILLNTDYFDDESKKLVSRANVENVENTDSGETIISLKISDIEANETINISLFANISRFSSLNEDVKVRALIEDTTNEQYVSNEFIRNVTGRTKNISLEEISFVNENKIDNDTIVKHGSMISMEYTISNNDLRDANIEITKSLLKGLDDISVVKKVNGETIDLTDYINNGIFVYRDTLESDTVEKIIFTGRVDVTYILEDQLEYEISVFDIDSGYTYSKNVLITTNNSQIKDEDDEDEKGDEENPESEIDDNEKWGINDEDKDIEEEEKNENEGNKDEEGKEEGKDEGKDEGEDEEKDDGENGESGKEEEKQPAEDDKDQEIKKYTISGTAWIDNDANGKRDTSEITLKDLKIMVQNATTGQIIAETTTDLEGKYVLTLPEGKYILLFLYNDTEYYVTTYQAKGVAETVNSDVIKKNITINGENITVGATDEINLISNIENTDIGLVYRSKFDLKVEKYISKVTVSNNEGVKTTEYNNTSLAKTEISSKHLNGSLVVVEYTIKITNIGDIAGYIGEIIDDVPSSLEFKSSMNPNWYLNNNKLYNLSLENKKLDVNESSEVKIILTKTMTESNTGLINNTAYIQNSYNEKGINDLNTENSKSSADLMISIKTGVVFKFITITLVIIIIEFSIVFIIAKKFLLNSI